MRGEREENGDRGRRKGEGGGEEEEARGRRERRGELRTGSREHSRIELSGRERRKAQFCKWRSRKGRVFRREGHPVGGGWEPGQGTEKEFSGGCHMELISVAGSVSRVNGVGEGR